MDLDPTLLYLAAGPPLCTTGLRCFARYARGASAGWVALGVVPLALGIDSLRLLDARVALAPWPWARGVVWGLVVLAAWAAVRRVWRDLGLSAGRPAAPGRTPGPASATHPPAPPG